MQVRRRPSKRRRTLCLAIAALTRRYRLHAAPAHKLSVIYSLLTGSLVSEKVDPAVQHVVRSQMNAVDSFAVRKAPDLFEIECPNGMPRASIDKLREVRITKEYNQNAVGFSDRGEGAELGRLLACVPSPYIDGWLIKHGPCPPCRRKLWTIKN